MHWKRLLFLLVVVLGLGAALLLTQKNDAAREVLAERHILPQLETSRVSKLVVHQLAGGERFDLERDRSGEWWMTDPVDWRADSGVVRTVLDHLRTLPAELVSDVSEPGVALDPGIVRLEITEQIGGVDKQHVVRIGGYDLGSRNVYVALGEAGSGSPILRVSRALRDTPDLGYDEFRSRRLVEFEPSEVVAIRRKGALEPPLEHLQGPLQKSASDRESSNLEFEILADGSDWLLVEPYKARIEPALVYGFLMIFSQLRVAHFYLDDPEQPRAMGFDPAWFEVEVELANRPAVALEFGSELAMADRPAGERTWYVRRKGQPNVFTIASGTVYSFTQPLGEMLDANVFQVRREEIQAFEVQCAGRGLRFRAGDSSGFSVTGLEPGDEQVEAPAIGAEPTAVQDLLAELESLTIADFLPLDARPAKIGEVNLELQDGRVLRADLGGPLEHYGVDGFTLRRQGEDRWGFVLDDLCAVAAREPREFASRTAFEVAEYELLSIELEGLGRSRKWLRDPGSGQWKPEGSAVEDREFALLVDRLRSPRVREWSDDFDAQLFAQAIEMNMNSAKPGFAPRVRFASGTSGGEPVTWTAFDGRMGAASPELYRSLEELLLVVGK